MVRGSGRSFRMSRSSASIPAMLPVFLIERFGFSQAAAGLTAGMVGLASFAGNLCYGVLSRWMSDRVFVVIANLALLTLGVPIYAVGPDLATVSIASCALAFFMLGLLAAWCLGMPTAQTSPRALRPWRNGADRP